MTEVPRSCAMCIALGFERPFCISRRLERAWRPLGSLLVQVEVAQGETLATYCMTMCREAGLAGALNAIGVPVPEWPRAPDGLDQCALCEGPVDIFDWHTVFAAEDETRAGGRPRRQHVRHLARLCRACGSLVSAWKSEDEATSPSCGSDTSSEQP